MKKRQIILDFTSLLDVIMIILFFFIIFSSLETDNLKKDLEDKQQQVSAELEEAKATRQTSFSVKRRRKTSRRTNGLKKPILLLTEAAKTQMR